MSSKKTFYVMMGALVLIVLCSVAGTMYGKNILKQSGETLLDKKREKAVLAKDEEALTQAKQDIEKYKDLDQVARSIVPQEKDQARTVRELVAIAGQSGVQIESINFPESTLGEKPTGSKKSKDKKAQPAPPAGATQLTPVEGLDGVFSMPITLQLSKDAPVTYAQLLGFLKKLEQNRRTSHVTNISIQPDEDNRNLVHFSMQINAYIKP